MSEISRKLEYVSEITREEIKQFTRYDEYKNEIDKFTGQNNLDFPYEKAEVNEFVIKLTMLDGSHLFLPIFATDGKGLRHDKDKGYTTIHRPVTTQEKERKERELKLAEERKEWELEQRAKNASSLEKAKQLIKKKVAREHKKAE